MARRNAVRIKIDGIQDVEKRLATVGLTLRSPAVTREIQRGAEVMAGRARARAPQDTGKLRQGIYTASTESYRFSQLSRNGKRINSPLRYPPRRGQVVVVSSVFYGLWVERGRKRRKGVGRQKAQRFFRVGVKEAQPVESGVFWRRLEKLVEERWNAGFRG